MRITPLATTLATTVVLGLVSSALALSAAVAAPAPTGPPAGDRDRFLDRARSGPAAITALGDRFDDVARLNGRTPQALAALLREDRTVSVDPTGRLRVTEPVPSGLAPGGPRTAAGPFPNSQTFDLHSRPGASRVLFLDFDGGPVSGTAWNDFQGIPTTSQPAFDIDGSPGTWGQAEHDTVQSVWQRVAEDFAPFDVDVTTRDPGAAALNRVDAADQSFGTRVLITPSDSAALSICGGGCGGVAYVGVFNEAGSSYYHPAWVFPQMLSNVDKYIAEAASHEAGHNLGLDHDGTSTQAYYTGHSNWAPIMGVGYFEPLVQWSRGEYADANNTQDDLAVMQSFGLPLRGDDHGSTLGTATALGTATGASGVVETNSDVDVFAISRTCSSSPTVTVRPAPNSPDLDARLRILNSGGGVVGVSDPASGQATEDVATGLSATLTTALAPGSYYLEVQGVGARTPSTGYSGYGSIGQYTVTIAGCPTDSVAPTVIARAPAVGATGVSRLANVTARFSEPVVGVSAGTFRLRNTVTGAVVSAVVSAGTSNRWVLNPSVTLGPSTLYTARLAGGASAIRDAAGNPLTTTSWSFRTGA